MDRVSLAKEEKTVKFFSSGSTLLDLALGGGWAVGRIFNIVGDKSVGKTGNAIEAFANFARKFPKGRMRYAEAEAAFDNSFAGQLGFPDEVEKPKENISTVEGFTDDLYEFAEKGGPSLYILDSLDALSDDFEVQRFKDRREGKTEKGSMGAQKAKEMSELFRLLARDIGKWDCTLGIVSQIRDNIGVTFGDHHTRSGGHALDFYSTHCLWLHNRGNIEKTIRGQKVAVGTSIFAKVKKNKVGWPFKTADYDYMFGFGIDDEMAMLDWLKEYKEYVEEHYKDVKKKLDHAREVKEWDTLDEIKEQLKQDTIRVWSEVQKKAEFPIQKYSRE